MSLAEVKSAVDALSIDELAELAAFIRERDQAAWDRQTDRDFAEDGRLHRVAEDVHADIRAGRLQDRPRSTRSIRDLEHFDTIPLSVQKLAREK